MEYNFKEIEKKWKIFWKKYNIFRIIENKNKKKYYILNMFPYPSGSGLHIGHCLGYIASDIYARYKRLKGFNVLNPMGFDSFGLPAEQYAILTGKNPDETTHKNEKNYKNQMENIGISFDWSRILSTRNPSYYCWTQWMFIQIFNSWYDKNDNKAKSINILINEFKKNGNYSINAYTTYEKKFNDKYWNKSSLNDKETILQNYRLAFLSNNIVNWCPKLGTVLANDEINNGKSIRGGYLVYKKKMLQWNIRITAYSKRLIKGLNSIECSKSLKRSQINWIGEKKIFNIYFKIENSSFSKRIELPIIYPEFIFGITFIVLSKDHFLSKELFYKKNSLNHIKNNIHNKKYELNSVIFTQNYVIHPFIEKKIPIFISDFFYLKEKKKITVGIPGYEKSSKEFASKFKLEIIPIYQKKEKNKICINSFFLNGLNLKDARKKIINYALKKNVGKYRKNYKMHDATFSRQRYWGEPIPIFFKNGIPNPIPLKSLPLLLPKINDFHPKNGKSPLSNIDKWSWNEKTMKIVSNKLIDNKNIFPLETSTMPSWAGSSWYFLRYMDVNNNKFFISKEKENYWKNVDLYIGGAEHSTGHLIYARFWNKFLKDRNWITTDEPFKKILNQGMMLNHSAIILKVIGKNIIVSFNLKKEKDFSFQEIYIDISLVKNYNQIDLNKFIKFYPKFKNFNFFLENGKLLCKRKLEKMSKSKYNIINPDSIIHKYGSDIFRMYEMFLGPISQSKFWEEKKIIGIKKFINKFWNLFHQKNKFKITEKKPNILEYKILHNFIQEIDKKIESYSFNTCISSFMIITNKLIQLKCNKRKILQPLIQLISPFAPCLSEELWNKIGEKKSIMDYYLPSFNSKNLLEKKIKYSVMFNGKLKFIENFDKDISINEIKKIILNHHKLKILKEKSIKKLIIIPKKIINILY
ncbi:class I tRNA ligase family protein [Blattabacterium cuenoti]|uniref:class I tRNA ligase family protein n=1 Tax=Blattabacterium cuenoti TaxID=1653831 RepID=UPI00163BA09B|nr:class I tRNA ligase family protein [Blattabacterium cuenoti]